MNDLDFYIPEKLRGRKVVLPEKNIELAIPREAFYLNVNPLEDEEELIGCQGNSWRQQLNYYDRNKQYLTMHELEHEIATSDLMHRLEGLLEKQY